MQMTELILRLLPSASLDRKIHQSNYTFSQPDLLRIIFHYAKEFDWRIELMERFAKEADYEVASYARKCIAWQKDLLARFKEIEVGEVYELTISCGGGWEEDFICSTFDAAMKMIDLYYDEYGDVGASETADTRYTLVKRRIYDGDPHRAYCEDQEAICILGPKKRVLTIEDFTSPAPDAECDGVCLHCEKLCLYDSLLFPCFWKEQDVVRYTEPNGKVHYGICLQSEEYDPCEFVYVIPLDCEPMRYHAFAEVHRFHDHIAPPLLEVVSTEELDEQMWENCQAYVEYLIANEA